MKYYCDTEFTSFEGELMSIALVPEDESKEPLYIEIEHNENLYHPWVKVNVVPHLEGNFVSKVQAAIMIRDYFRSMKPVEIIADWPEDLAHFYNLLIVGPGMMVGIDNVQTRLQRTDGAVSSVPHHALHDAIALRNFWNNRK